MANGAYIPPSRQLLPPATQHASEGQQHRAVDPDQILVPNSTEIVVTNTIDERLLDEQKTRGRGLLQKDVHRVWDNDHKRWRFTLIFRPIG